MRDHATRRAMPVEQSILWKPLHDAHYVVASLQARDGGRRKIFLRQQALATALSHVRKHGRRSVGLLLGQFYECNGSGTDYMVVESIGDLCVVGDESETAATLSESLATRSP